MNQFQNFPQLLQQFSWFLPEKPHYRFGLENSYSYLMGIKYNGILLYQYDNQEFRPLLYRTFIKNECFFLEIKGEATYQILEIVLFPNSAKMKIQREFDNHITLSGYEGNFSESIFSKNPLTGLKA